MINDNKEYVQKLNKLFEENKNEEFFSLADFLKKIFAGETLSIYSENQQVHIVSNDLFFVPELQAGAIRLLLTKEEFKRDLELNIKSGSMPKNFLLNLFNQEYCEPMSLEDEYEIKPNEIKELKYKSFIEKLLILKENNLNINIYNDEKEKFFINTMSSINEYEYIDEFIINKIPEFFDKLKDLGIALTEDEFNQFLSKQNLVYTDEVLPGIKGFCEMFPDYKIYPETLQTFFNIENPHGEYSPYRDIYTPKHMKKFDLSMKNYDTQENLTLLKYFIERDSINFKSYPFNNIDFLKETLFQETASVLIQNGARITGDLNDYSPVVGVQYLDFLRKEKENIKKSLNDSNIIKENKKRL